MLGSSKLLSSTLVLFTLAIGILIGTVVSSDAGAADDKARAAPDATPLVVPEAVPAANQFTPIVDKVSPSVVNISVEQFREAKAEGGPQGGQGDERMEDFFRRFFGMPGEPGGQGQTPRRRPNPRGEGSGVIVDSKGYIITNNHVVEDADRVRVRFANGGERELFEAKVIGRDEETDIAVIKVEDAPAEKLIAARIGNSEAVNVGDWAIAIGSPFGFRETVGIISAMERQVQSGARRMSNPFQRFFQTDAAINPGNSGGPLVNIRGEIIGINTAIVSRTGGNEGLGFALPSNEAVKVYNQIIEYGRVARGSIGITFQANQDPALLRTFGADDGGVLVGAVKEGGPAEDAGIQEDDVITSIDGQATPDGDTLIDIVASTPVGNSVPVEILRDGKSQALSVKIADRAELFAEELGYEEPAESEEEQTSKVDLGISVQNLTEERRAQMQFTEDGGVLVTDVDTASFAEDIGLVVNDIIVAINRKPVESISDVREIRDGLSPGDDVAFKVMRAGPGGWATQYVAGVLPETDDNF